jgi:predicted XRE-type DNA-binding protein
MPQDQGDFNWMRNKDFYLGIVEAIEAHMIEKELSPNDVCLMCGIEQRRLGHIFSGMIEDLTLLELDNLMTAVGALPRQFILV